jgi:hypothetical protein
VFGCVCVCVCVAESKPHEPQNRTFVLPLLFHTQTYTYTHKDTDRTQGIVCKLKLITCKALIIKGCDYSMSVFLFDRTKHKVTMLQKSGFQFSIQLFCGSCGFLLSVCGGGGA